MTDTALSQHRWSKGDVPGFALSHFAFFHLTPCQITPCQFAPMVTFGAISPWVISRYTVQSQTALRSFNYGQTLQNKIMKLKFDDLGSGIPPKNNNNNNNNNNKQTKNKQTNKKTRLLFPRCVENIWKFIHPALWSRMKASLSFTTAVSVHHSPGQE